MEKSHVKQFISDYINKKSGNYDESAFTDEASFQNCLGMDSLDTAELIQELENEYDIHIADDISEKVKTLGAAVDMVIELSNGATVSE